MRKFSPLERTHAEWHSVPPVQYMQFSSCSSR